MSLNRRDDEDTKINMNMGEAVNRMAEHHARANRKKIVPHNLNSST